MLASSGKSETQRDENALMSLVAARDGAAFHVLVSAHAPTVHRIAYRMTGDASEAEDITQETMLRLWQHASRWQASGPGVGSWLKRIAVNLCLDRLRRRRWKSDEDVPERVDDAPLADVVIDAAQASERTRAAVLDLPERQRAAIILTYYEDLSNAAAAEMLELNIKAFESLLLRARAALRQNCEAQGLLPASIAGATP